MANFWESGVWGFVSIIAVLLISLLLAKILKNSIKWLNKTLIPTSVLAGLMLLIVAIVYEAISGTPLFDTEFFAGSGTAVLEIITYHALALGFIATTFQSTKRKLSKQRTKEIFNTGATTVSTYLLQGVLGLGITLIAGVIITGFFSAAGALLPFGFGQGTGQALNYGKIYESEYGFTGGGMFGLSVAALGFISSSIGGVIYLNIMRRRKRKNPSQNLEVPTPEIAKPVEDTSKESDGKMTIQVAIVVATYFLAYLLMYGIGVLVPSLRSILYGFNFLFGVIIATIVKLILNKLNSKKIVKRQCLSPSLMKHIGDFCFDIMIVAGVAAIRIYDLQNYWLILLILAVVGTLSTYFYNKFVARKLFPEYSDEQFLVMYGMLTGTASTGMMLLREVDENYQTPAADNLVYQNLPAIVFGFPMMLLATLAPKQPLLTFGILVAFFIVMNLILFRSFIFKRRKKKVPVEETPEVIETEKEK